MAPALKEAPVYNNPQPQPYGPPMNFPQRRRRRWGWGRFLLIVVIALAAVYVLPTPWAFHIGGRFTPTTQWAGYGTVQASNGGHYLLFTQLQGGIISEGGNPACDFQGGCETLRGTAQLCAENGKTYLFDLTGQVHSWWSTDGARTGIDLTDREHAPPLLPDGWVVAFHGKWAGPVLKLSSPDNSFTEVFTPRGGIRKVTSTADAGTAATTIAYGSRTAFQSACHTLAAGGH